MMQTLVLLVSLAGRKLSCLSVGPGSLALDWAAAFASLARALPATPPEVSVAAVVSTLASVQGLFMGEVGKLPDR